MRSYCHAWRLSDPAIRTERALARSEIENGGAKGQYCVPADAVAMRWPCRRDGNESGVNANTGNGAGRPPSPRSHGPFVSLSLGFSTPTNLSIIYRLYSPVVPCCQEHLSVQDTCDKMTNSLCTLRSRVLRSVQERPYMSLRRTFKSPNVPHHLLTPLCYLWLLEISYLILMLSVRAAVTLT